MGVLYGPTEDQDTRGTQPDDDALPLRSNDPMLDSLYAAYAPDPDLAPAGARK